MTNGSGLFSTWGTPQASSKALDREVNQLLDDFKKQTDLFDKGQVSSKDYTDALSKLKSEVGGLSGAIKDLGGGGGGGGLDAVTSKIFALERGHNLPGQRHRPGTGRRRFSNLA